MSEVKRYDMKTTYRGHESWDSLEEDKDGGYVNYEDYAALESKCAALAAENAGLKSGAMDEIKVINRGGQAYCVKDGVQVNPMYARGWNYYRAKSLQSYTPATDAFLTEVRAQGVEMFAQWCRGERDFTLIDEDVADAAAYEECVKRAEYFSAQIRKGGEQK